MKYKKITVILITFSILVVVGYFYLESFKRYKNTEEITKAYKDAYEKADSSNITKYN